MLARFEDAIASARGGSRGSAAEKVAVWESDAVQHECHGCGKKFGFLTRKHHCRMCGRCAACARVLVCTLLLSCCTAFCALNFTFGTSIVLFFHAINLSAPQGTSAKSALSIDGPRAPAHQRSARPTCKPSWSMPSLRSTPWPHTCPGSLQSMQDILRPVHKLPPAKLSIRAL